jgi:hypothetical protein
MKNMILMEKIINGYNHNDQQRFTWTSKPEIWGQNWYHLLAISFFTLSSQYLFLLVEKGTALTTTTTTTLTTTTSTDIIFRHLLAERFSSFEPTTKFIVK